MEKQQAEAELEMEGSAREIVATKCRMKQFSGTCCYMSVFIISYNLIKYFND